MGDIGHRDTTALAEGHAPVAVEATARVDANRQRADLRKFAPSVCKKIAHRALHRRRFAVIPVHPQNAVTEVAGWRHPDMGDRAGTFHIGEQAGFAGLNDDRRRYFPADAELPRRPRPVPSVARAPVPFSPVKFSGLIERLRACESCDNVPREAPNPL